MKNKYKYILLIIFVAALLQLMLLGGYRLINSRHYQVFGQLVDRVETKEKVVALTLDDAPSSQVDEVLRILKEREVAATFYVVGQEMEKYPAEVESIVHAGSELGNHSYSHQWLVWKAMSFIKDEIVKTNALIRKAGYEGAITFRPPYGKKLFGLPWYLRGNDMKTIMWDVEPDTYCGNDTTCKVNYTLENTRPGSIILMHPFCADWCSSDREALPQVIDGLLARGFRFVTVDQLLGSKDK